MATRIFSCHHSVPEHIFDGRLFQNLVTNIQAAAGFLSDLDGRNIAGEEDFSELRQQYFVWQNLLQGYDHVGFEHYRRPIFIDPLPPERLAGHFDEVLALRRSLVSDCRIEPWINQHTLDCYFRMRDSLADADLLAIERWLESYDIIAPRPYFSNVRRQWQEHHDADLWERIMAAVLESSYFRGRPNYVDLECETLYFKNIYIMRAPLFDEYMNFCFEVLSLLKMNERAPVPRLWGFISERLFTLYVSHKRVEDPLLRFGTLPVLFRA